jgi:putative hydrolase of HD superfamily
MSNIEHPESVAEHTFSLAFLTMQLAPVLSDKLDYPLNTNKLIQMALLHDIGEIETGDLVISRGGHIDVKKREAKEQKEMKGIIEIFRETDKSHQAQSLFTEMIERITTESKILWQLDKLDMGIQALKYEIKQNKDLSEFFENVRAHLTDDFLIELHEDILKRRPVNQKKSSSS